MHLKKAPKAIVIAGSQQAIDSCRNWCHSANCSAPRRLGLVGEH